MIKDIQVGDIISTYNEYYKELGQYQILYIPVEPGMPWVVKEVTGEQRKWRLWTQGPMQRVIQRTTHG